MTDPAFALLAIACAPATMLLLAIVVMLVELGIDALVRLIFLGELPW